MTIVKNLSFTSIDSICIPNLCVIDGSENPDSEIAFADNINSKIRLKIQVGNLRKYQFDKISRRIILALGYSSSIAFPIILLHNTFLTMAVIAMAIIAFHFTLMGIETFFWPPYFRISVNGGIYDIEIRSAKFARRLWELNRNLIEIPPGEIKHG